MWRGEGKVGWHKTDKGLTAGSQATTGHETRDDSIPSILLLPPALDGTVECREHATPDPKIAPGHGRSCFYCGYGTHETLAL